MRMRAGVLLLFLRRIASLWVGDAAQRAEIGAVNTAKSHCHVFAAQADIRNLACDAWLLPTNLHRVVLPKWTEGRPSLEAIARGDLSAYSFPDDWGVTRAAAPRDWKGDRPMPILTITGSEPGVEEQDTPEWYVDALDHFMTAWLRSPVCHLPRRSKPLLAVPLIGTGSGGALDKQTELAGPMNAKLQRLSAEHNVDFVVTVRDSRKFALIQYLRRKTQSWPDLKGERLDMARDLAAKVREEHLVLFLGAGVSMGAGLPSWGQLLDQLAQAANIDPDKKKALEKLDFLDYAQILKEDLEKKGLDLNEEIAKLTSSTTYALTQALLANWQVTEVVTQNYDDMFERASRDSGVGEEIAVIPYKLASGKEAWLLKMHGDVHHPQDIVLTRDDYLHYDMTRGALSGVVQTLLMTKHMLILGFSLSDEHFIELVFTLRQAVGGMEERSGPLGTVVTLKPDSTRSQLWRRDFAFASASDQEDVSTSDAARQLEILIDYIGAWGRRDWTFLFYDPMEPLLSPETIALRDGLRSLVQKVGKDTPITKDFISMLRKRYGYGYSDDAM